jgi:hypothetical protein
MEIAKQGPGWKVPSHSWRIFLSKRRTAKTAKQRKPEACLSESEHMDGTSGLFAHGQRLEAVARFYTKRSRISGSSPKALRIGGNFTEIFFIGRVRSV